MSETEKSEVTAGTPSPERLGSQFNRRCENCLWWKKLLNYDDEGLCEIDGEDGALTTDAVMTCRDWTSL